MYEELEAYGEEELMELEGLGEFEGYGEDEWEFEGLGEFEGYGEEEWELEGLGEFEGYGEDEWELEGLGEFEGYGEDEWEFEGDPLFGSIGKFFKKAINTVKRVAKNPVFSRVLKTVARTAAPLVATAIGGPAAGAAARWAAQRFIREAEFEDEYESEAEFEAELEMTGANLEALAEMECLAGIAAKSKNPATTQKCINAMARKISKFTATTSPAVKRTNPSIGKGIRACGLLLRSSRRTQPLISALPKIVAKTVTDTAKLTRLGRPPTKKSVAAIMAKHTAKTLASPRQVSRAAARTRMATRRVRPMSSPQRRVMMRRRPLAI
ncbi:MAG: hypothetical protein KDJ52_04645 [Anaerolineae bacterium]|nr:hypothetical protein [Anaerolineae bacterium]